MSHLLWPSLCDESGEDSCDVASRVPFAGYTSQPNEPLGTFALRGCRAESRVQLLDLLSYPLTTV